MPVYNEQAWQAYNAVIREQYTLANVPVDDGYPIWGDRAVWDVASGALSYEQSCAKHLRECRSALGLVDPIPPVGPMLPLRVEAARLRAGSAWVHWQGISEFSAIHLCRTGQESELIRRLDRAAAAKRNGIRVLMMKAPQTNSTPAWNAFDLSPTMPGYRDAFDRTVTLASERGLYLETVLFADAQIVMPDPNARRAYTAMAAEWCRQYPTVLPQIANEPYKNGWDSSTDPALLQLAAMFEADYGRPFSIGDPPDVVTDPPTGNPLHDDLAKLAGQSSVLVLHPDRSSSGQWARWVDHLKGFEEVYDNPHGDYRIHDETMGAASVTTGSRDSRPDAHLAASLVCAVMGIGFTYHYVSETDDSTPGLDLCALQAKIPASPNFRFYNANPSGPVVTTFSGPDKVRCCSDGAGAWAVAYGYPGDWKINWMEGWKPTLVHKSDSVQLWRAGR